MLSAQARHSFQRLIGIFPVLIVGIAVLLSLVLTTQSVSAAAPHVDVMVLQGEINPAALRFLARSIENAQRDGAQALVLEIDTPGGDLESMKSMVQAELASDVPVIAYVTPAGGRAASAGSFVTLAAHIAMMAPTTRIGAASPVTSTGGDIGNTLKAKIENDLVASMTSIQQRYHRNAELAKEMITTAKSYDDTTAVQRKIVDGSAPNLTALLDKVNGRTVTLNSGRSILLQTAGVSVQTLDPALIDSFYGFLLNPNVIFILFIVAMLGIYLEISHPGAILPGVLGAIALILFLFGAGSIAPNWAGLALMVLAFVFLVMDVQLPTHGVLTVGAVISLIVGAFLFFNSGGPYDGAQVDPLVVYVMGGVVGAVGLTLVTFIIRAHRQPVRTGMEGMLGARVTALTPLMPEGRVRYGGEDWAAILEPPATAVDPGAALTIVAIDGLRLHVRPVAAPLRPVMEM